MLLGDLNHRTSKHIRIKYHHVKELIKEGEIKLVHKPTDGRIAVFQPSLYQRPIMLISPPSYSTAQSKNSLDETISETFSNASGRLKVEVTRHIKRLSRSSFSYSIWIESVWVI